MNPVRQIPIGKRPKEARRTDVPWIDDDALVRRLFHELKEPINLMFYIGSQSALRTGEICGLRMSDLGFLDGGVVRVRFSYDGPLKEDKNNEGKSKFVPASIDAENVLGDWLERRARPAPPPRTSCSPAQAARASSPARFNASGTASAPCPTSSST